MQQTLIIAVMATTENKSASQGSGWINGLLLAIFSLGSLWLADLGFRAYERNFLLPTYPEVESVEPVNLAQLSYNDGLVPRATAEGEFRILSFGDSFTYSVMEPSLSFNGIVEKTLDQALPDQTVRVVNLGEPGTGPNSFRLAHDYWSQIFRHQAVLFHIFLGNDIQDDAYLQSPLVWEPNVAVLQATNPFLDAGSKRVPNKFPLRMLDYAWAAWLSYRTTKAADLPAGYNWAALTELDPVAFQRTYFIFLDNTDPSKLPALLPGYQQILLLMQRAQQLAEQGIKVAVVLGPSEPVVNDKLRAGVLTEAGADPSVYELGLAARIIERLQQSVAPDVPLLDLSQSFRDHHQSTGERLYFRHNTHWDQAGNQLAGEVISNFLLDRWFGQGQFEESGSAADWRGPELVSEAEIQEYLRPLLGQQNRALPQVTGAARDMQLFDGVTGDANNWAMAELGQAIEIVWDSPVKLSQLRIFLHDADGRSYGLLVEGKVAEEWQVLADRRTELVSGELSIDLPGAMVQALRLTGTSNSRQIEDPANHYLHIEEIEWAE